jgi:DNA polymerase-3 subunit gamma/tau
MQPLFEQYRPTTWADVVGQDRTIQRLFALRRRGLSGRAYWLSGLSGTGKTTIARLLAADIADPFSIQEIDATDLTIKTMKELQLSLSLHGFGQRPGRVAIVNEAHGLYRDVMRQLLVYLEALPRHAAMIFTTTLDAQQRLFDTKEDANPLLSRCIRLELATEHLDDAFARRAKQIARTEGLDGRPLADYLALVQHHRGNFRAVLQAIEAGDMLTPTRLAKLAKSATARN